MFQLKNISPNLFSNMVYDVHWVKFGDAPQQNSFWGELSLLFWWTGCLFASTFCFSADFPHSENNFIRPYRLYKGLCLDYPDHATQLSRPYTTL